MPAIKQRASVACRLEDAFEYVADWKNYSNYIPMFVDIEPTSFVQYGPGTSLDMTIMLGTRVEMRTTVDVVEFIKNKKIVMKSMRGMKTKTTWEFTRVGDEVMIAVVFEFEVPPGMTLRDEERAALTKDIEGAWGGSLTLLKWMLESQPPNRD